VPGEPPNRPRGRAGNTGFTSSLGAEADELNADPPVPRAVEVDEHDGLPLAENELAADDGDRLRAAEEHGAEVTMRIYRLLRAPPLELRGVVDVPSVRAAPVWNPNRFKIPST